MRTTATSVSSRSATVVAARSRRRLACIAMAIAFLPTAALAQNQRRGMGNGLAGLMGAGEMRQALDSMDLTGDEKTKVDAILQKAQTDARDAMQGLRDATPEERADKVKDLQKLLTDSKAKVLAELTPEQKTELSKKLATLSVTRTATAVEAEKKKLADLNAPADQKKQTDNLFDETSKSLDGFKTDADGVKDDASQTELTTKVQKAFADLNRQLTTILGDDEGRQVVQAGRLAMRGPTAARRPRAAATTEPAK